MTNRQMKNEEGMETENAPRTPILILEDPLNVPIRNEIPHAPSAPRPTDNLRENEDTHADRENGKDEIPSPPYSPPVYQTFNHLKPDKTKPQGCPKRKIR